MIESERLKLTNISMDDRAVFQELLSSPVSTRYLPKERTYTEGEIDGYLQERVNHWAEHGFGSYVLEVKSSGKKIGYAGIEYVHGSGLTDIRYGLLASETGRGYALEGARACLSSYFAARQNALVYGIVLNGNLASLRILQRLGMEPAPDPGLYDAEDLSYFSISGDRFAADER